MKAKSTRCAYSTNVSRTYSIENIKPFLSYMMIRTKTKRTSTTRRQLQILSKWPKCQLKITSYFSNQRSLTRTMVKKKYSRSNSTLVNNNTFVNKCKHFQILIQFMEMIPSISKKIRQKLHLKNKISIKTTSNYLRNRDVKTARSTSHKLN